MKSLALRHRLASLAAAARNAIKKSVSAILPLKPMEGGAALLDRQYASGFWDCLADVEELGRFSVVAGLCHFLHEGGSILEIGCGEGVLHQRLDAAKYSRFVGLDISAEAIGRAATRRNDRSVFVTADAATYSPEEEFDIIIFNEVLEYFDDPLDLMMKYEAHLSDGGTFIVSMFVGQDTVRTKRIWKRIERRYAPDTVTRVANGQGYSWIIKVFRPPAASAR